jgi:hypothetical protein
VLTGVRAVADWPMADNHAYLLCYWCLALAIAMWLRDLDSLARNARLLIGLTFAFAALVFYYEVPWAMLLVRYGGF